MGTTYRAGQAFLSFIEYILAEKNKNLARRTVRTKRMEGQALPNALSAKLRGYYSSARESGRAEVAAGSEMFAAPESLDAPVPRRAAVHATTPGQRRVRVVAELPRRALSVLPTAVRARDSA